MKIMLCGKNKIAIDVLQYLLTQHDRHELVGVFVDGEHKFAHYFGDFPAYLKEQKISHISLTQGKDFAQLVNQERPDLIYSIQFSVIMKRNFLQAYGGRIINLHHSLLPYYRGMSPVSHAVKNGEAEFGVSLHLIDEGIDTGPVVDQKKFCIKNLTNRQVYAKCEEAGLALVQTHHHQILKCIEKENSVQALTTAQCHMDATYYPKDSFDYSNTQLNFNQTAKQVHQEYLAYTFPPVMYPIVSVDEKIFSVMSLRVDYMKLCYSEAQPGVMKWLEDGCQLCVATRDCWVTLEVRPRD